MFTTNVSTRIPPRHNPFTYYVIDNAVRTHPDNIFVDAINRTMCGVTSVHTNHRKINWNNRRFIYALCLCLFRAYNNFNLTTNI